MQKLRGEIMAHFAQLNENNEVVQVIVVSNDNCCGGNFPDSEPCGQEFIRNLGLPGTWKQTSYNNNFRRSYAGIGYTYNEEADVFISPQPFPSWTLSEDYDWRAPVAYPDEDAEYYWDEENLGWVLM